MSEQANTEKPSVAVTSQEKSATDGEYPSTQKRLVIMGSCYLAMFLLTLDQNIISTAIPSITNEFNSLQDVAWYGSAYLLTACSFQLLMGKVYKLYKAKPVYLMCIAVFEIGSAICGAAPSSTVFIVGRAIAGLGSSGLISGSMVIMVHTVPLRQRPVYQSLAGVVFAVGSILGPLLGGAFTDNITWRWCFYINLPVGAVTLFIIFFILHIPNQKLTARAVSWSGRVQQLDPLGNLLFFPGIICLILALQWGGTTYSWSNVRIIILLVLCVVLTTAWIGIQLWKGEAATVPARIVKKRSIAAAMWFGFFNYASLTVMIYYLPIWFQAVQGVSALDSALRLLPTLLSTVVASVASGILVSKLGYCNPLMIAGTVLSTIGIGLLTMLTPTSNRATLIGFQVILGLGFGLGLQQPMNVIMTILDKPDISTGSALVMLTRFLGAAIFLPVGETIFASSLVSNLEFLPGVDASTIANSGVTDLGKLQVSQAEMDGVLMAYNGAVVHVFYLAVALSAATVLGSLLMEWRSLKTRDPSK